MKKMPFYNTVREKDTFEIFDLEFYILCVQEMEMLMEMGDGQVLAMEA